MAAAVEIVRLTLPASGDIDKTAPIGHLESVSGLQDFAVSAAVYAGGVTVPSTESGIGVSDIVPSASDQPTALTRSVVLRRTVKPDR